MRTYARIQSGAVAELLSTSQDITHLFHPSLRWIDVTGQQVEIGWVMQGTGFAPPPARAAQPAQPAPPSLSHLQAQINDLTARVAALAPHA